MTADLLRRAAAHIREVAQVATPGPWERQRAGFLTMVTNPTGAEVVDGGTVADHDHIATWSPDVAELVADVLDNEAAFIEDQGFGDIFLASPLAALAYRVLGEA